MVTSGLVSRMWHSARQAQLSSLYSPPPSSLPAPPPSKETPTLVITRTGYRSATDIWKGHRAHHLLNGICELRTTGPAGGLGSVTFERADVKAMQPQIAGDCWCKVCCNVCCFCCCCCHRCCYRRE